MKHSISTLAILLSLFDANSQTLVSTNVEKRNAVVYDYTGVKCTSCVEAHTALEVVKTYHPEIIPIAFHVSNFAVPFAFQQDYRTLAADSLYTNSAYINFSSAWEKVFALPTVLINAHEISLDTVQFIQAIETVQAEDSYVNIGAKATIADALSRELVLEVECYYTSAAPSENYLNVMITQNGLKSKQSGAFEYGLEYPHHDMFRMVLTPLVGGESLGTPEQGELLTRSYAVALPDSIWYATSPGVELNLNNIDIAVFISDGHETVMIDNAPRLGFEIQTGIHAEKNFDPNLSIAEFGQHDFEMELYPNPLSEGNLHILTGAHSEKLESLEILDFSGRIVFEASGIDSNAYSIPASILDNGLFVVIAETNNGHRSVKKLVKYN